MSEEPNKIRRFTDATDSEMRSLDDNEILEAGLHIGKLTQECKTTVTEQFKKMLEGRANKARCTPADLMRDALYLVFSGETFTTHVANDRCSAFGMEGRKQGGNCACKPSVKES